MDDNRTQPQGRQKKEAARHSPRDRDWPARELKSGTVSLTGNLLLLGADPVT